MGSPSLVIHATRTAPLHPAGRLLSALRALAALTVAVLLAASPVRADLASAQQALNEQNYRKALADAVEAIERSPVDAYRIRASAYAGLGEKEQALGQIQRALSFAPADKSLIVETGRACMAMGRKDQAAEYLEKASALDPADYDLLIEYLGLLDANIRYDNFVSVGTAALQRFPAPERQRTLHTRIAGVEEKRREYARAAEHYAKSYEGVTPSPDQLLALGKVWSNAERWEEAEQVLDRALAADPDNHEIVLRLGRALWEQERREEAGALFIELKNADSPLWDQLSFGEQRHTLIQFRPAARVLHQQWGIFPFLVGLCVVLGVFLLAILIYLYRLRSHED